MYVLLLSCVDGLVRKKTSSIVSGGIVPKCRCIWKINIGTSKLNFHEYSCI